MAIRIRSRKSYKEPKYPKFKVSHLEYEITKILLDAIGVEYEEGYSVEFNYWPMSYNGYELHFAETYEALVTFSNDMPIFRPLKTDKHANILIDMFETLDEIRFDNLTTMEYENKFGNKCYKGYFVRKNAPIQDSYTYGAPSPAILKCMIVGKYLLYGDSYTEFMEKIKLYNKIFRKNHQQNIDETESDNDG